MARVGIPLFISTVNRFTEVIELAEAATFVGLEYVNTKGAAVVEQEV